MSYEKQEQLSSEATPNYSSALTDVRNLVNKLNNELKKKYFSEKITMHPGNTKEFWKIINQVLNNWSKSTTINKVLVHQMG